MKLDISEKSEITCPVVLIRLIRSQGKGAEFDER
jgi:hypothetical protein